MNASLNELLKQNSRSFWLTLRVLPRAVRSQIGLAYLLARTTDTIADTELVPLEKRLDALQQLRERILGTRKTLIDFSDFLQHQSDSAERVLLEKCEDAIAMLNDDTSPVDRGLIRKVLDTITSGQELDLKRFARWGETPSSPDRKIIALQNESELDDYTFRVAGCVGDFWTEMCVEHLFRLPEIHELGQPFYTDLGIRFGKGLQLVNILRDLPADLKKGRCYLPADKLAAIGLTPADLLNPASEAKLRPLYNHYLDLAEEHLTAGWKYTCLIPHTWLSLRLACAWPILIGVKTIGRLRTGHFLDPQRRIKVPRSEVYRMMAVSVLIYPIQPRWRGMFEDNLNA